MMLQEVTQRRLERYEERRYEESQAADEQHSVARFNRCLLTAARDAGIATELPDDLADTTPRQVEEWSRRLLKHIAEATAPLAGEA